MSHYWLSPVKFYIISQHLIISTKYEQSSGKVSALGSKPSYPIYSQGFKNNEPANIIFSFLQKKKNFFWIGYSFVYFVFQAKNKSLVRTPPKTLTRVKKDTEEASGGQTYINKQRNSTTANHYHTLCSLTLRHKPYEKDTSVWVTNWQTRKRSKGGKYICNHFYWVNFATTDSPIWFKLMTHNPDFVRVCVCDVHVYNYGLKPICCCPQYFSAPLPCTSKIGSPQRRYYLVVGLFSAQQRHWTASVCCAAVSVSGIRELLCLLNAACMSCQFYHTHLVVCSLVIYFHAHCIVFVFVIL